MKNGHAGKKGLKLGTCETLILDSKMKQGYIQFDSEVFESLPANIKCHNSRSADLRTGVNATRYSMSFI